MIIIPLFLFFNLTQTWCVFLPAVAIQVKLRIAVL